MSMAEPRDLMDALARLEQATPDEVEGRSKRQFKRFSVRADAKLEPVQDDVLDEPLTILLRDISRAGAGFLVDRFIEPNSVWRIRFRSYGHFTGSQPVMIRFCRLVQDELYIAGGQFVVEPFLMHQLGVSEIELEDEDIRAYSDRDISRFLGPEDIT